MGVKRNEKILNRQKAIIIGSLLGDGYLDRNRYGSICLEIKQKSEHKDYIFWLWKELKNLCNRKPSQRTDNYQWRLITKYGKELNFYYNFFYKNKKKIIRKDIAKILNSPLSLAVWYMDDGTIDFRPHSHYAYLLATYCFSKREQKILVEALKKNFGLKATVQKTKIKGKKYYRLYIGKKDRKIFETLIRPYIVKSFYYKLPS